jgi:Uma2 family endonuclease
MSVVTRRPSADRVIIHDVSWETYQSLLNDLRSRSSPRLAYDQGVLEIMSPQFEHENANFTLASIVTIALEELDWDFEAAGSTTFKREALKRGFEPDSSFYIQQAGRVRGKKKLDQEIDPAPELIIEIDVTSDSMNKFGLYAALRVTEVWRFENIVEIWILDEDHYVRRYDSATIPIFNEKLVLELMESSLTMKRPAWLRQTRARIREVIAKRDQS